jgi:Ca2+-binding RTX toxin-like protein
MRRNLLVVYDLLEGANRQGSLYEIYAEALLAHLEDHRELTAYVTRETLDYVLSRLNGPPPAWIQRLGQVLKLPEGYVCASNFCAAPNGAPSILNAILSSAAHHAAHGLKQLAWGELEAIEVGYANQYGLTIVCFNPSNYCQANHPENGTSILTVSQFLNESATESQLHRMIHAGDAVKPIADSLTPETFAELAESRLTPFQAEDELVAPTASSKSSTEAVVQAPEVSTTGDSQQQVELQADFWGEPRQYRLEPNLLHLRPETWQMLTRQILFLVLSQLLLTYLLRSGLLDDFITSSLKGLEGETVALALPYAATLSPQREQSNLIDGDAQSELVQAEVLPFTSSLELSSNQSQANSTTSNSTTSNSTTSNSSSPASSLADLSLDPVVDQGFDPGFDQTARQVERQVNQPIEQVDSIQRVVPKQLPAPDRIQPRVSNQAAPKQISLIDLPVQVDKPVQRSAPPSVNPGTQPPAKPIQPPQPSVKPEPIAPVNSSPSLSPLPSTSIPQTVSQPVTLPLSSPESVVPVTLAPQNQSSEIQPLDVPSPLGNVTTPIQAGQPAEIQNFGGVGRGVTPTSEVLGAVDTLKFTGAELTAENMLLNVVGNDLVIEFETSAGVAIPQTTLSVTLKDFKLENLDNLSTETWASVTTGNILFDGQSTIQDSFDVIDSERVITQVLRPNTVTFLNALPNQTQGYENSNDVINGLAGDDQLVGLSGNDKLRGGEGDDYLLGGSGDDVLAGNNGRDVLNGGEGRDRFILTVQNASANRLAIDGVTDRVTTEGALIQDFQLGQDKLSLSDPSLLNQISAQSTGDNTVLLYNNQPFATLLGVQIDSPAILSSTLGFL